MARRFLRGSEELKESFATGNDPGALLEALFMYLASDTHVPKWIRDGFVQAYNPCIIGEISSWDDVFGHPPTKAQTLRWRRNLENAPRIQALVAEAKARGEPIDSALFRKIGLQLGIGSATLVSELYSATRKGQGSDW